MNGLIYEVSSSYYDDNGIPTRRVRRTPHISVENLMLFFEKLEIVAEVGLGLDGETTATGAEPQLMVRWSDDGGKSWENEEWVSLGAVGKYRWRVILRRLGKSRDRVFELIFTDPVPLRIIDGFVNFTVGKPS